MVILSLPISIPIALAIMWEDKGPVFYRQTRWGRNGTRFRAYKFRTMVSNSDRDYGIRSAEFERVFGQGKRNQSGKKDPQKFIHPVSTGEQFRIFQLS